MIKLTDWTWFFFFFLAWWTSSGNTIFFVSIKYLWILACLEGHGNWVCCFIEACRHVEKMRLEGKTGWKKSWDRFTWLLPHLSLLEISAPSWHVLVILPFLDWDIHESFRKEKAWLKSANWNKIFAYNRGMASAWAIHSFKTKMQLFTVLQTSPYLSNLMFPLIVSNDLFSTFWQLGLVFHIAFPTCLILRLPSSLWKLTELFIQ